MADPPPALLSALGLPSSCEFWRKEAWPVPGPCPAGGAESPLARRQPRRWRQNAGKKYFETCHE